MSTFTFLRLAGVSAARCSGSSSFLAQRLGASAPLTSAVVQRKNLSLTPAKTGRTYGPQEESEKVDDIHHWVNERYVAAALIPVIPTALIYPHPVLDTLLIGAMVLHTHWRLSGVVQDYIHGPVLFKIGRLLVLALSIATFGSMCYFNYSDIGFARFIRLIYSQL